MIKRDIGFIGAGKMAFAFVSGLLNASIVEKKFIAISDVDQQRINLFKSLGIKTYTNNKEIVKGSSIIFLSVKPNKIFDVLNEIKPVLTGDKVLVSIAAGIKIEKIEKVIGSDIPIFRVMPNAPVMVGAGMSVYCFNNKVKKDDISVIEEILKSVGEVIFLNEEHFDIVTGLSGSGPAYVFLVINSLAEGGVKMGLPKDIALKLATQTVLGSAKMVMQTNKHPEELIDMVTSPGGTTIEALHSLENNKVRSAFIEAVEKATLKSKMLLN
jgi:pyrroline-5-carboxylate reductase